MIVPGCGCNVSTTVLRNVVGTGWGIQIFYTPWFWGHNSDGNGSGFLMGPGTMRLDHAGPMALR
jgi:hypothetical protein